MIEVHIVLSNGTSRVFNALVSVRTSCNVKRSAYNGKVPKGDEYTTESVYEYDAYLTL